MIVFEYVKYKNILSSGNVWTKIDLNKNKSTLIVGENGAGKSTMLDALSFGLYGKPFRRINKPQLVNSINQKHMEVHVSFRVGQNHYLIKRGIKPNIFEIWKNGEMFNQDAAARDYQAYLEENILKMNYKSFGQIVVLGSSTFVPFMQLPAKQRREVIEDLLDIQIFTSMNTLLKEKVSMNKDEIQEIKYDIGILKNRIDAAREHNASIREMKEEEVNRIKSKVQEHLEYIEEQNAEIETRESEIKTISDQMEDSGKIKKRSEKIQSLMFDLKSKMDKLNKENRFFEEHDECPTCTQSIDKPFKANTIQSNEDKIRQIGDAINELVKKQNDVHDKMKVIEKDLAAIQDLNLKIQEHRANIRLTKTTLKSIREDLEKAEQDAEKIDTQKILDLEEELKTYRIKEEQLINEKEILTTLSTMLKDGGIKTLIIRQYVPIMNKLINKYLSAMDFFVDFQLDESFNETIRSRFRDAFSYSSFSEGEKLRIDLALLFTWRAVSKMRNSMTTNILIMDEIMDSSLDNAGTEEFLKIINELTNDSNVFIISHKGDQLFDKFDHVVRFKKQKNFSVLAE